MDQSYEKPFLDQMRIVLGFGTLEPKKPGSTSFTRLKKTEASELNADAWRFKVDSFVHCEKLEKYFQTFQPQTTKGGGKAYQQTAELFVGRLCRRLLLV